MTWWALSREPRSPGLPKHGQKIFTVTPTLNSGVGSESPSDQPLCLGMRRGRAARPNPRKFAGDRGEVAKRAGLHRSVEVRAQRPHAAHEGPGSCSGRLVYPTSTAPYGEKGREYEEHITISLRRILPGVYVRGMFFAHKR